MRDGILTRTYAAKKPLFSKSRVQEINFLDNERREFKNSYSLGDRGGKTTNVEFQQVTRLCQSWKKQSG